MSEDNTKSLDGNATNPTPFEDFVRQQFELLHNRIDSLEAGLRAELTERFVQLSRQGLETKEQVQALGAEVRELKEFIRDVDDKLDPFIKEQLRLKRDLRDVQESLAPKN